MQLFGGTIPYDNRRGMEQTSDLWVHPRMKLESEKQKVIYEHSQQPEWTQPKLALIDKGANGEYLHSGVLVCNETEVVI